MSEVITYTITAPGVRKLTFAWERKVGEHLFEGTVIRQDAGEPVGIPERNQFLDVESIGGVFDKIKELREGAAT